MKQKLGLSSRLAQRAAIFAVLAVVAFAAVIVPNVRADDYDAKIQELRGINAQNQAAANDLQSQANSYQEAISKLQAQIDGVLIQLAASQTQQANLEREIAEKQAELDRQRALLSDDIKAMYVDGEMSAIEMLATSRNLSEFVDKEEYRNSIQKKIEETLVSITKLQSELKAQKTQVDQLVEDQRLQQAQLAASRQQQAEMLAYTEAQKAEYTAQIAGNNKQIAELRRQQAIANARYTIGAPGTGANCGGDYPGSTPGRYGNWGCNYALDNTLDNWGMYNRQCVSYTAFKVHADFLAGDNVRDMPEWGFQARGNANQWDDNARGAGIPVNGNPERGAIAVSNDGTYGHVMYVESVSVMNGRQAIYVSDYNQQWDGRYREYWRYTTGLVFIHF